MFNQNAYGQPSQGYGQEPLAFYQGSSSQQQGWGQGSMQSGSSYGGNMGGMGNMGNMGSMGSMATGRVGGMMQGEGKWWQAFGTGGLEGEPSLMEGELWLELHAEKCCADAAVADTLHRTGHQPVAHSSKVTDGSQPNRQSRHQRYGRCRSGRTTSVLLCVCLRLATREFRVLGLTNVQSGRPQFSYIYGVGALGTIAIYTLLNLMSENGIDAYHTASVLGYCLLPMVLGGLGVGIGVAQSIGYALSVISVLWCTYSASSIFVAVLQMNHQRLLVAYPIGLFYGCFALLSIFQVAK